MLLEIKLEKAGLSSTEINTCIPGDVIPLIQSFLGKEDFRRSLTVSKQFYQLEALRFNQIVIWASYMPIPRYLTKVKLITGDDDTIKNATQLTYLDLSENDDVYEIGHLVHLKELDMNSNILGSGLKNLDLISLICNENVVHRNDIKHLIKLNRLTLFQQNMDWTVLKNFTQLEYLDVCQTNISDKNLLNVPNLKTLVCGNSKTLQDISCLQKLESLNLHPAGLCHIKNLANLKELHCSETTTDDDLKNLINLTSLDLTDSLVTRHGITHLINLKKLVINNHQFTPDFSKMKLQELDLSQMDACVIPIEQAPTLEKLMLAPVVVFDTSKMNRFTKLRYLETNGNVTDAFVNKLSSLKHLRINDPEILSGKFLTKLPNLKYLEIYGMNYLPDKKIAQFMKYVKAAKLEAFLNDDFPEESFGEIPDL